MTAPILPGAEAWSADGGPDGVLVLHGFTGNPTSMRGLAEAFAAAGYSVELPLLPGHGTAIEDMIPTTWADWTAAADDAFGKLAARCQRVAVAGLSMGGSLATWLAERRPEVGALVLVNPAIEAPAESFRDVVRGALDGGMPVLPAVGNDVADPDVDECAYDGVPAAAALTFFDGLVAVEADLGKVTCPVLLFTSPNDHVVPPSSSDTLAAGVSGPVERVTCERSFHVATIDLDRDLIRERSVEFLRRVLA